MSCCYPLMRSLLPFDKTMSHSQDNQQNIAMPHLPFADPTHFEWYMAKDDSPQYPMTFTFVWTIRGPCKVSVWEQALREAIPLHPLTQCIMSKDPVTRKLVWQMTPSNPAIHLLEPSDGVWSPECFRDWQFIDLGRECGIKIGMVPKGDTWQLICTFHHAVSDGIGALEFSSDLFDAYDRVVRSERNVDAFVGSPPRFAKPTEIGNLSNRHLLDRSIPHPVSRWTATKFMLIELVKYMTRPALHLARLAIAETRPASVDNSTQPADPVLEGLHLVPIKFDEWTTRCIRQAAQARQCSLNEFLIAACMSALEKHKRLSLGSRKCWITAILPINMRPSLKGRTPCHNGIGYSILRRASPQCADLWSNAKTIKTELQAVQDWSLAGLFLDTLGRIRSCPVWIHDRILKNSRPGTFVFSYIGALVRRFPTRRVVGPGGFGLGDCRILDFAAAPPTRPGTELAILASTFHNELVLWIRSIPEGLSDSAIESIAKFIRGEIKSALQSDLTNSF